MPDTYTKSQLIDYVLHLADNSLVLGHRNSEWTGHGPILEQDIALSNISLDLIGQARNFYQYAASLLNDNSRNGTTALTEDSLAYLRGPQAYKSLLLLEQTNGDWGKTIMRQFLFSCFQYYLYQSLMKCQDEQLAAITEKSIKEITYHLRWSSEWVIRLGDGTAESRSRMQHALNELFSYTQEMFIPAAYEQAVLAEFQISVETLRLQWEKKLNEIISEAGLTIPVVLPVLDCGKEGRHTAALKELLTEMQFLQRTYPGATW